MLPRITVKNAGPGSLEFLTGLWHRTWYPSVTPEAHHVYRMRVLTSPWARRCSQVLVLEENGAPRAGMIVLTLSMRLRGKKRKVAGIAAVVTDPEHRGRGLAARLVTIGHRRLADAGHQAALLFTEIGTAYYAKLGYVTWPLARRTLALPDSARTPRGLTFRPATARDLPAMRRLLTQAQKGFTLGIERPADYFRHLMSRAVWRDELFAPPGTVVEHVSGRWIAERGGEPVAHARLVPREKELAISEGGYAPGEERALAALAVARAKDGGHAALSAAIPVSLAAALGLAETKVEPLEKMMMAPLTPGLDVSPGEHCIWPDDWF